MNFTYQRKIILVFHNNTIIISDVLLPFVKMEKQEKKKEKEKGDDSALINLLIK